MAIKKLKKHTMNLESHQRPTEPPAHQAISVSQQQSSVSRPSTSTTTSTGTMPQRTPFAIQELLGLSDSSRSTSAVSAVTPAALYSNVGQSSFSAEHHQMQMAASRMAYFNAHAAVAAAFLPHNMAGAGGGPLGFSPQGNGGGECLQKSVCLFVCC